MAETVREKCLTHFSAEYCECIDESDGCGAKLVLTIVSVDFHGTSLLTRHRMVNTYLSDEGLLQQIHALTIKAWTLDQWETKKKQQSSSEKEKNEE